MQGQQVSAITGPVCHRGLGIALAELALSQPHIIWKPAAHQVSGSSPRWLRSWSTFGLIRVAIYIWGYKSSGSIYSYI